MTMFTSSSSIAIVDPAYKLQGKKDAVEEVRKNADWLLFINSDAILGDKEIKKDSPAWKAARDEVAKRVAKEGERRALHVRFYFTGRGVKPSADVEKALSSHVKKLLADVDVYVVCVDEHVRNDNKTWSQFLKDMEQGKKGNG